MKSGLFLIFAIAAALTGWTAASPAASKQQHWALLVAGSRGYYNYRHQADIAHAFQIMKRFGIPESNIVTMMYDDVANNRENPFPGTLINKPNGPEVYHGVVKDYVKDDVTPENFLKVLTGDAEGMKGIGSGKVIASGPNDHVFVNFADHGGPGLIAFPEGVLHVAPLNKTIWRMYGEKKFHKMVMYIEACESGSMFDGTLPNNINVMALTAANGSTSSYACYYDSKRRTFLGDLFSVKWMEDSDLGVGVSETLMAQFKTVKAEVNKSEVCMFGDREIASHYAVAEFQGDDVVSVMPPSNLQMTKPETPVFDAVPAPDVPLHVARRRFEAATTKEEKEEALKEYARITSMRELVDEVFEKIATDVAFKTNIPVQIALMEKFPLRRAYSCYEASVDAVHSKCFHLGRNDYPLRRLQTLVNLCESGAATETIKAAISTVCRRGPWEGAN